MSMEIVIKINGDLIDIIEVINRGPADTPYQPGDFPGGPGERIYEWHVNGRYGFVKHRRRDGARALAAKVLEATK